MPSVINAYPPDEVPFGRLNVIELVSLFGCLTRARERMYAETEMLRSGGVAPGVYADSALEVGTLALRVMDTIVYKLRGVTPAECYLYYAQEYFFSSLSPRF